MNASHLDHLSNPDTVATQSRQLVKSVALRVAPLEYFMGEPIGTSFIDAFFATAASFSDIARMAPTVVKIRSDAMMASMVSPLAFDGEETLMMVSEKIAAMTEGAMRATFAAGTGMGLAMMTGVAPANLAFTITDAAVEPMRRQVQANFDRLTKTD